MSNDQGDIQSVTAEESHRAMRTLIGLMTTHPDDSAESLEHVARNDLALLPGSVNRRIRRCAILTLLFFSGGQSMTARRLRNELEATHGQVAMVNKVCADILWLQEVGLLSGTGDAATLTERGRDVVLDRAAMPGEV